MKRALLGLSVLLAIGVNGSPVWSAASPPPVDDDREASFMPSPALVGEGGAGKAAVAPAPEKSEPPLKLDRLTREAETPKEPLSLTQPPPSPPSSAPKEAGDPAAQTVSPQPVAADAPVAVKPLADIDPDSIGLLGPDHGGLGTGLWKDTSRAFVDKLLPAAGLPTASPTLNDLARRLLLTTAVAPAAGEGKPARHLTSMRVERLIALGDTEGAWKLASLGDLDKLDDITLRLLTETALLGSESAKVCEKIPALMAARGKPDEAGVEWQKALMICKLREKEEGAVQLGLDLLREQGARDDIFLFLVSRNVLGRSKQLPRQLTPLRATTMAVLSQLDLPLPPELYARPDASLIAPLLATRSVDEKARIVLAEKAAAKGLVSASQLAEVYKSVIATPEEVAGASSSLEKGPRARAVLYQALQHEMAPQKKVDMAQKLIGDVEGGALTGSLAVLAAEAVVDVPASSDFNSVSAQMARLMTLGGKTDQAMAWLRVARDVAGRLPEVGKQMEAAWPLFALSGFVPDGEYAQGFAAWLKQALAPVAEGSDDRSRREQASRVLLILDASGYAVTDEAWLRVIEAMPAAKQLVAPPLLMERIKSAGASGRRGETALLALLVAGGGAAETPIGALADTIRALRQAGLKTEAQGLAREAVISPSL